jgi:hypothetical protein
VSSFSKMPLGNSLSGKAETEHRPASQETGLNSHHPACGARARGGLSLR